jgi:hypothetical protein
MAAPTVSRCKRPVAATARMGSTWQHTPTRHGRRRCVTAKGTPMENLRTDRSSLLVDQLDRAREIAQVRLTGLGDEEYLWEPAPGAWSIRRRGQASSPKAFGLGAWVLDRGASDIPAAEYAEIDRQVRRGMTPDKVAADWGVSTQRVEEILNRDRWHDSVAAMSPEQLDTPGFGQYPDGVGSRRAVRHRPGGPKPRVHPPHGRDRPPPRPLACPLHERLTAPRPRRSWRVTRSDARR